MRILHVLDHFLPLHSGYTFRTLEILRGQRDLGWETIQLTTPRHPAAADIESIDGWQLYRTRLEGSFADRLAAVRFAREMAATARRLDGLIETLKPDLVHAHSPLLNGLPALRAGRRRGIPVVYEVRAFWEDAAVDHARTREGSARYRATRALETHVLKRAAHVTTICEGLRAEIVARGVPAARVTVIPNAVDAQAFHADEEGDPALRERLGLAGKEVVGFVGSFYAYEGLDLLIDAAARLVTSRPALRVLLVGVGPQEEALRAQAAAQGLQDRVVFTGRVPHADVHRYYGVVDLLAYPRHRMRLTELVTPLKPLEAMASGRVLLASDVGGHRELVRDGETGFLFPAGDAAALAASITRVLDARDDWTRVRSHARRFVEQERTWKRSVAGYVAAYEAAVQATGAGASRESQGAAIE
jgi:PEP-CTERM/exosortase A-associated glycosyltransferase